MGTRSLIFVFDAWTNQKPEPVACIYQQFDGYPEGVGAELAAFLNSGTIVNGIGDQPDRLFNGAGCLAAQLVKDFKDGPGGLYLYPTNSKDVGEEFVYGVYARHDKPLRITCHTADSKRRERLYDGGLAGFSAFCAGG